MFGRKKNKYHALEINKENFMEKVMETEKGVLLDFWAPWCGPCKVIGPIIDELAEEYEGRVVIGKVNVDQNPELSSVFKVKSIPNLVFIKNRTMIENIKGLVPKPNLQEMIEDLISYEFEEEE
jgi:thioredoxin 1